MPPNTTIPGWRQTEPMNVGDQWEVDIRLTSGVLTVKVRLTDHRTVYGRSEWEVAPLSGRGTAWVQEKSLREGTLDKVKPTRAKYGKDRKAKAERAKSEPKAEPAKVTPDQPVTTPAWAASRQPK